MENTKGSAFAYQGLGFFYIALVFVGDQPQRRLAFCNWFGVNPEPDLLVRPVIGRRQQRIIAIVEMRIVRPRFEAGTPRQTASRSKMDVVGAKPFLRELNGIAIYRSVVEYRFGKREETRAPASFRWVMLISFQGFNILRTAAAILPLPFVEEIVHNHVAPFFKLIDVIIGQFTRHQALAI